jgi:hypothetical protein
VSINRNTVVGGDINIDATNSITTGTLDVSDSGLAGDINLKTSAGGNITIGGDLLAYTNAENRGNITLDGNVLLSNNVTVQTGVMGNLTITGTVDGTDAGGQNLTLTLQSGSATFEQAIGNSIPIGSLIVDGGNTTMPLTLGGNITSKGNIRLSSSVQLNTDVTLTADQINLGDEATGNSGSKASGEVHSGQR